MSDRRVRQYVALLKLPAQVQEIAQQQRLNEGALRRIAAMKDSAHQIAAAVALARSTNRKSQDSKNANASKHRRSDRCAKRKRTTSRCVLSDDHINQLMKLASKLDARYVCEAGDAIGERLSVDSVERRAAANLSAALSRHSQVSVQNQRAC
jgi:hypothetical protein